MTICRRQKSVDRTINFSYTALRADAGKNNGLGPKPLKTGDPAGDPLTLIPLWAVMVLASSQAASCYEAHDGPPYNEQGSIL